MLARVVSQCRNHRATVQVCVVRSTRDRSNNSSRATSAARRVGYPPRRTRSRPPNIVVTERWKYQLP